MWCAIQIYCSPQMFSSVKYCLQFSRIGGCQWELLVDRVYCVFIRNLYYFCEKKNFKRTEAAQNFHRWSGFLIYVDQGLLLFLLCQSSNLASGVIIKLKHSNCHKL